MSFLVIDVGTSSCRAAMVSVDGEITSITRHPLDMAVQSPPIAEVDCDLIWKAVCRVITREIEKTGADGVDAVGVSSILGYVLLGRDNRPLAPAILYADNRAAEQVKKILERVPQRDIMRLTGRRASPELLAAKLLWYGQYRPDLAQGIRKVIGLKDEIVRRLTGVVATDLAHANYTMLFNIAKGRFDENLMLELGFGNKRLFPDTDFADRVIGRLSGAAAVQTGLQEGTPVVLGSSDGTTAMYSGGVQAADRAVLVSGTTDVLMMLAEGYPAAPETALTVNSGPQPGMFLVGGATGFSGGAVSYFESLLKVTIGELEPLISALAPGSEGLLVLPGLTGERAPYWNASSTGAIFGLKPDHGPHHLFRALIEGTGLRIRRLIGALGKIGLKPGAVRVTGGLGASGLANRIRADVTGIEMIRMAQPEATCLGTAMFCKSGLMGGGAVSDISEEWCREESRFVPDLSLTSHYEKASQRFESLLNISKI